MWGSGRQTRSCCYIDDCIEGIGRVIESGHNLPVNLGSEELVTIDELARSVISASGKRVSISHDLTKPQGVAGRNSDNTAAQRSYRMGALDYTQRRHRQDISMDRRAGEG